MPAGPSVTDSWVDRPPPARPLPTGRAGPQLGRRGARRARPAPLTSRHASPPSMIRSKLPLAALVLACSALREAYRKRLLAGAGEWRLFFLTADKALIASRLAARKHRYMPASLLDSQFATLEEPARAIRVDVSAPIERSVDAIVQALER